jgi:hypothetical protein
LRIYQAEVFWSLIDKSGRVLLEGGAPYSGCLGANCPEGCGGEIDECGVCDGSGIPDGECDCDGNKFDECGGCGGAGIGDLNSDGYFDILDIMALVNCVLVDDDGVTCEEMGYGCAGDINGDGNFDVLDILTLTNCVLTESCGVEINGDPGLDSLQGIYDSPPGLGKEEQQEILLEIVNGSQNIQSIKNVYFENHLLFLIIFLVVLLYPDLVVSHIYLAVNLTLDLRLFQHHTTL